MNECKYIYIYIYISTTVIEKMLQNSNQEKINAKCSRLFLICSEYVNSLTIIEINTIT